MLTDIIFIVGLTGTLVLIGRLIAGSWKRFFAGLGYFFATLAVGAVACGALIGLIALWAFIAMTLTGATL